VEGIVDLKEKEWICSFNIDSVTNVKGNFKYKEDHPLVNKDTYKLYLAYSSYEFYYYGADYIDRPYVGGNNYYVSQNVTSFTLYYVDSYTDTNTVFYLFVLPIECKMIFFLRGRTQLDGRHKKIEYDIYIYFNKLKKIHIFFNDFFLIN
jgi:hypothetical protein